MGECDADAASRELAEELGVRVRHVDPAQFEFSDPGTPYLIAFCGVEIVGEPTCHEHTALGWFTLDEAANLPLAPSDAQYVGWLMSLRLPPAVHQ